MNRATRDKMTARTSAVVTAGNACLETPPAIFAKLNADFGPFDLDLTADAKRHLCPRWFGPGSPVEEYDALTADWLTYGAVGYSNPPYGFFVTRMLEKAHLMATVGFETTLLLPLRVTREFQQYIVRGSAVLLFCNKRINFWRDGAPRRYMDRHGHLKLATAIFDSIIVRFEPDRVRQMATTEIGTWEVPKHV